MSRRENPLEFGRRNGPTAGKANPADWESGPKGSDRVGTAGKGNAKAKNWKASPADRESDTKESDRVGNARPKGKARRKAREGEYKGSVRSLRTQQRAKSQRQIC
jgi:hypothetical protein